MKIILFSGPGRTYAVVAPGEQEHSDPKGEAGQAHQVQPDKAPGGVWGSREIHLESNHMFTILVPLFSASTTVPQFHSTVPLY